MNIRKVHELYDEVINEVCAPPGTSATSAAGEIPFAVPADEPSPPPAAKRQTRMPAPPEKSVAAPPEPLVEVDEGSSMGLVELLLKDPRRVDALNRDEARQPHLIPRFLGIALSSYVLFVAAMIVIFSTAPAEALPRWIPPLASWTTASAFGLLLAFTLGLVAAAGVCLPSCYFYGLLAGVKMSWLQVSSQIMESMAAAALLLIGVLPIYVAGVLGMIVFDAPPQTLTFWLCLGLVLPFLAGLRGTWFIYRGVMGLADTLPPERRCRRQCFLRRLTLAWAACYAAVAPVMVYRLWEFFAATLA